jgi:hypothetical protein
LEIRHQKKDKLKVGGISPIFHPFK